MEGDNTWELNRSHGSSLPATKAVNIARITGDMLSLTMRLCVQSNMVGDNMSPCYSPIEYMCRTLRGLCAGLCAGRVCCQAESGT